MEDAFSPCFFLQFFVFHDICKPAYLPKSWISPKITNIVFWPLPMSVLMEFLQCLRMVSFSKSVTVKDLLVVG